MIGYFEITEFLDGTDAAGAAFRARAKGVPDSGKVADLYLPPYLRKTQCGIDNGSRVFAVVDDVTGIGAALFGENGADFGYFMDADIEVKKSLTVTDDIKSTSGDVLAGTISLSNHTHPITVAQFSGVIDPVSGAATGAVTGNTDAPAGG